MICHLPSVILEFCPCPLSEPPPRLRNCPANASRAAGRGRVAHAARRPRTERTASARSRSRPPPAICTSPCGRFPPISRSFRRRRPRSARDLLPSRRPLDGRRGVADRSGPRGHPQPDGGIDAWSTEVDPWCTEVLTDVAIADPGDPQDSLHGTRGWTASEKCWRARADGTGLGRLAVRRPGAARPLGGEQRDRDRQEKSKAQAGRPASRSCWASSASAAWARGL